MLQSCNCLVVPVHIYFFLQREQVLMPVLDALATFRDQVRVIARREKQRDVLALCDDVRDNVLPNLGVRLEDHEGRLRFM